MVEVAYLGKLVILFSDLQTKTAPESDYITRKRNTETENLKTSSFSTEHQRSP